jgi:hypothetical protein
MNWAALRIRQPQTALSGYLNSVDFRGRALKQSRASFPLTIAACWPYLGEARWAPCLIWSGDCLDLLKPSYLLEKHVLLD